MLTLTTYRGVIRDGKVDLTDAILPEGTEVVVVAQQPLPSIEEQKKRLATLSQEEWEAPFKAYQKLIEEYPGELDIDSISDEELVELVHQVREERVQWKSS